MVVKRDELLKQWAAINRALAASLEMDEVLRAITDCARELMGSGSSLVLLADGEGMVRTGASAGMGGADLSDFSAPLDERVIDRVRKRLELGPEVSLVAAPIVNDDIISGILVAIPEEPIDPDQRWMIDALADQAAIALRNARLHEMELDLARRMQQESKIALAESERRAAQAIRSQERWLEAVFDLAPSPILLLEPAERRLLFANRAAKKLTGETHRLVPREALDRITRGESVDGLEVEWEINGRNSTLVLYAETCPPLYGHSAVVVVVLHDISRIREVEDALRNASDIKDNFLATLSHELRMPLTVILGWTGMLNVEKDDEALRKKALVAIEGSVQSQRKLIDDLLDVSRIVKGTLRIEASPFDLSSAVGATVDSLRPVAVEKGIELRGGIEPALGVQGDMQRFQQVVGNLLSNAMKFTPSGGWIDVELLRDADHAVLTVADSGEGIPPDFLPFVFDRFRQADGSTTRRQGGLGLGLSIVKSIVDLHGGSVTASSAGTGSGTTMTVRIPLAQKSD
jgi:signal transduction histidine kinase